LSVSICNLNKLDKLGDINKKCGYAIAQDSYCKKYVDIIKAKDAQIKALSEEVTSLKAEQQLQVRKHLNKNYNKEMQKFDKQRSGAVVNETSSIIISDKPTP